MKSHLSQIMLASQYEAKILHADRSIWLVLTLLVALTSFAFFNGISEVEKRDALRSSLIKKQEETKIQNIALLERIMNGSEKPDPFANPANPASMGSGMASPYVVLPATALSSVAFGQSDLLPNNFKVSYRNKATFMYDNEIENPWNLLSGRFDFAFVVIYILPLLVFAFSYNLLSAEKEQGTLRMLLSQPVHLLSIISGKLAARVLPLLGFMALLPIATILIFQPGIQLADHWSALLCLSLLIIGYGFFWFALAVYVNTLGRSSATNALILIFSWVVLVLIIPVLINIIVETISPTPSRTELATRTRLVTIEGLNQYNDLLRTDYNFTEKPDALLPKEGKFEVPPRLKAHYLISKNVDIKIDALLKQFDTQLAGQQKIVDRWGFLSPAILTSEGLTTLAGNNSRRYLEFKHQVENFHQQWRAFFEPKVLSGKAITKGDFDEMPKFEWRELKSTEILRDSIKRVALLMLLSVVLFLWSFVRLMKSGKTL